MAAVLGLGHPGEGNGLHVVLPPFLPVVVGTHLKVLRHVGSVRHPPSVHLGEGCAEHPTLQGQNVGSASYSIIFTDCLDHLRERVNEMKFM